MHGALRYASHHHAHSRALEFVGADDAIDAHVQRVSSFACVLMKKLGRRLGAPLLLQSQLLESE